MKIKLIINVPDKILCNECRFIGSDQNGFYCQLFVTRLRQNDRAIIKCRGCQVAENREIELS